MFAFVADEQVDEGVVLTRVEVVKRSNFAAQLDVLVLEEDVLAAEALFFELGPRLGGSDVFLKVRVATHFES